MGWIVAAILYVLGLTLSTKEITRHRRREKQVDAKALTLLVSLAWPGFALAGVLHRVLYGDIPREDT